MTAKKQYVQMLTILSESSTTNTLYNKLAALAIETEDLRLKSLAKALAGYIKPAPGSKAGSKWIMANSAARPGSIASLTPSQEAYAQNIAFAISYCNQVIKSIEPEWVVHAKAAGWTPPPPPQQKP